MLPGKNAPIIVLCCLAATLGAQKADAADSLVFVRAVTVRGCPLTVYHHSASRTHYLAPAFCIIRDTSALLADATITNDGFIGGSHLNLPVLVTDPLLLEEARSSMAPLLQNRSLEFLQPLSARASDGWSVPLVTSETGRTTGHLRLPCQEANCHGLISTLTTGRWFPIEKLELTSIVRLPVPGSLMIEMKHSVSFTNRSRILIGQSSPNVVHGPKCSNLGLHEIVRLSESCHATVLLNSDRTDTITCTWQGPTFPYSIIETKSSLSEYHPIDGLLCIRPAFKRVLAAMPDSLCAIMCSGEHTCQAFSTASGSCELFLFDKCSLGVRDCGCTRRGRVFVRRHPGLEPGQLCPSGFGHDLCGVKYKVTEERVDWPTAKSRIESQPGLVIMANVIDRVELQHVESLVPPRENSLMWVGGAQRPGSAEPSGGWYWVGCNRSVSMATDMWKDGNPDNYLSGEHVLNVGLFLNDLNYDASYVGAFLSECMSPF